MKIKRNSFLLIFFFLILEINAQFISSGINLTGYEQASYQRELNVKELKKEFKTLKSLGFQKIRIPLAIDYYLRNDKYFIKKIAQLHRIAQKENLILVLSYFDHSYTGDQQNIRKNYFIEDWVQIASIFKKHTSNIYLDLANEPLLNPDEWQQVQTELVKAIRMVNPNIFILVGGTNYNSLYELSRMKPLPFENLIYNFHFYEPFLFTHQGTHWTGSQNSTVGIPYPFKASQMPKLNPLAENTPGSVNYRDYDKTGNETAILHKLEIISDWAKQNQVRIWCTEFGVTQMADIESRCTYLKEVSNALHYYGIQGFVWEAKGNFGILESNLNNCFTTR